MNYRRLGRTGLQVSEVSLGNWTTHGESIDNDTAARCVKTCFDAGINFFDTADCYAAGKAEEVLGKVIKDLPRRELVIASKCRVRMWPGPNGEGASRKHVMQACEDSLKRLQIDCIDLYQIHWPDPITPHDETLRAMDDLIRQGKVLYAGCSNYNGVQLTEACRVAERLNITRYESLQPCYNMLDRSIEKDSLPVCEKESIGIVVYSPLAQGFLTGKYQKNGKWDFSKGRVTSMGWVKDRYASDRNLAILNGLAAFAAKVRQPMGQIALAWLLSKPAITSVITGATSVEQVKENMAAAEIKLSESDLKEIEGILNTAS